MRKEKYEVVVVGAGPAGSVAAKTAAERGAEVLLIERNAEIGTPVKCAEGVSKELERFVEVDRKWVCAGVSGITTYGPDGTKFVLTGEGTAEAGYVLDRRLFDRFLAQQAADAGAEVRVRTQACGLVREAGEGTSAGGAGSVKGVYARSTEAGRSAEAGEGEDIRISADVVVAADGVESRVGRWAGIETRLRPSEVATCAEFLICGIEFNRDYCELFFGDEIAPKGYAWVFPKGGDCANVGVGIGGDVSGEKHRAFDYLRAFVRERFPDGAGKVVAEICGAVPLSGPLRETTADGLVLVGDAARHVNPFTGGGILYAIQAGEIAGEVVAKAVREKNFSKRRLREYEKRWRKEFGRVLWVGLKMKNVVLGLSSQELARFFQALDGEVRMKEYSERAFMKEVIKRNSRFLYSLARFLI